MYTKELTELPFYMQFEAEAEKFTCHGPKSFPTSCDKYIFNRHILESIS
jgi:hypothetical protein